jgi:ribosomal protein L29
MQDFKEVRKAEVDELSQKLRELGQELTELKKMIKPE